MSELRTELVRLLSMAEELELPGKRPNLDDPGILRLYVAILEANGITPEELKASAVDLFSAETFFPSPATVVRHAQAAKERRAARRREEFWASLVEAVDEEGVRVLAPRSRVRRGRLLAPGDETGDGSPAPTELPARAGSGSPSFNPVTGRWVWEE